MGDPGVAVLCFGIGLAIIGVAAWMIIVSLIEKKKGGG